MKEKSISLRRFFEVFFVLILLLLTNRRAWYCFFVLDDREYFCEYGNASSDFFWWGITVCGIVLLLLHKELMQEYVWRWKANWPLLAFMAYAGLSLIWSVNPANSVHTLYVLIAAATSAAGLATMYSREQILKLLLWFTGGVALLSLTAVFLLPQTAITQIAYLAGTWRGVFWHKNYLGSVMALGNGLFLLFLMKAHLDYGRTIVGGSFYFLTLFLVIMSQSATGLILLLLLNGLTLLYFAWRKWTRFLRRAHYVSILIVLSVLSGGILFNLRWFFSLIGKQPSLTGRVPLWQYLVREVVSERPWFGYGLETVWYERDFQVASGKAAGWGIVVVNGHSGYMDILLYLGMFGLIILLLMIVQGLIGSLRVARLTTSIYGFAPLLILAYVVISNVTISYLIEFESFHWVLLVLVLCMTTPLNGARGAPADLQKTSADRPPVES